MEMDGIRHCLHARSWLGHRFRRPQASECFLGGVPDMGAWDVIIVGIAVLGAIAFFVVARTAGCHCAGPLVAGQVNRAARTAADVISAHFAASIAL